MGTSEQWKEFCRAHAELFALDTPADARMLAAWWPLLGSYDLAELLEASRFLVGLEQASRKREHCGLIRSRILGQRREREKQWDEAGWREREDCSRGCDLGVLFVPHPRSLLGGDWVYPWYTCAVFCLCPRGESRRERLWNSHQKSEGKLPQPMSLADYEQRVPRWRELLAERESSRRDQAVEQLAAAEADQWPVLIAEVRRRLAERYADARCSDG